MSALILSPLESLEPVISALWAKFFFSKGKNRQKSQVATELFLNSLDCFDSDKKKLKLEIKNRKDRKILTK
jgi:hypothetical protein